MTPLYSSRRSSRYSASRGDGDFAASHDLEHVLAVLVGLPSIRTEIYAGLADVALAIRGELASMMGLESFVDAIPGHFDGHAAGQERARRVIAWLRTLG